MASGVANRWNKDDEFVIYAGSSRSLAALELVAHRNSVSLKDEYKLMNIQLLVTSADIKEIQIKDIPKNWKSISGYPTLQKIGSDWYYSEETLLLKVPSVLIPWEFNYLINVHHPAYPKKVKLESVKDFNWDNRLV